MGNNYIDASSDIYHFNFGPHSGKFLINFDGSVLDLTRKFPPKVVAVVRIDGSASRKVMS